MLLGLPQTIITEGPLDSYGDQFATRALQRLLKSRVPSSAPHSMLKEVQGILYIYRSSKGNEAVEWKEGTVISAHPHDVRIRISACRKSSVAYKDLRIRPSSALTLELMEVSVEKIVVHPEAGDRLTNASGLRWLH